MRDELWKVSFIKETAGANIDEARGEMKVMLARREIKNHFRACGKLRGISGSSWDSHPTMSLSKSEIGKAVLAMCSLLLLKDTFVRIRDIKLIGRGGSSDFG